MTGRSTHDALLRLLTSAELRGRAAAGDERVLGAVIGVAEAAVLCRADPERFGRLARFLGRHFYRERIVRLFAASRRLARERGRDPLALLDTRAFDALLEMAEVGSAATAEGVAAMVERHLAGVLGEVPYARDLVAYEGALFRTEAGPRRWGAVDARGDTPVRSASARVIALEWDLTALVAAARRGDVELPEPRQVSTRLLVALSPDGRVTAVRCSGVVEQLLAVLDGARSVGEAAEALGIGEPDAVRVLRQLAEAGAVEWVTRSM